MRLLVTSEDKFNMETLDLALRFLEGTYGIVTEFLPWRTTDFADYKYDTPEWVFRRILEAALVMVKRTHKIEV